MALTNLQQRAWTLLAEHLRADGVAPSLTEIARGLRLASAPAARQVVIALERKGYLQRTPNAQRSIRLVKWPDGDARPPELYRLSVGGRVVAGHPIEPFEPHAEHEWVPADWARSPDSFVLRVSGNSMTGDGILDGDLVVVQPTERANSGETVVARLADGSVTLKKIYFERGHVRLQPANPNVEAMIVPSVHVQGRVVAVLRRLSR